MQNGSRGDGPGVVHAALPEPAPGEPFLPGPVFAAPYHLDPAAGPGVNGYGRPDNPTRRAPESAVRAFAEGTLRGLGVETVLMPTAGPYPSFDGVRLVLLETPANPGLDVCDITAIAAEAHAAGALVAVDNTAA